MVREYTYVRNITRMYLSEWEIEPTCMLPTVRCKIFNLDESEVKNLKWVKVLRQITMDKVRISTHKNGE